MIAALGPANSIRRSEQPVPLENGERITAPEFFYRYQAMPNLKKAGLIEGMVHMGSPVRMDVHAQPDNLIQGWLFLYSVKTPGVSVGANGTVQLDLDNVPQPDALMRIASGGTSQLVDGYVVGPPELVVEISASTKNIDAHDKLRAYRRNGVKEYLNWRTLDGGMDWFRLQDGDYVRIEPDEQGLIHSSVFPGLVLNVKALLAMDSAAVTETLLANLGSEEHRHFVANLANRA